MLAAPLTWRLTARTDLLDKPFGSFVEPPMLVALLPRDTILAQHVRPFVHAGIQYVSVRVSDGPAGSDVIGKQGWVAQPVAHPFLVPVPPRRLVGATPKSAAIVFVSAPLEPAPPQHVRPRGSVAALERASVSVTPPRSPRRSLTPTVAPASPPSEDMQYSLDPFFAQFLAPRSPSPTPRASTPVRAEWRAAMVRSLSPDIPSVSGASSSPGSQSYVPTVAGESDPDFEAGMVFARFPRATPYERICSQVVNGGGHVRFPPLRWQQVGAADHITGQM